MELSRNKIILFVVWWVILFFVIVILLIMLFSNNSNSRKSKSSDDFVVWMVWDSSEDASEIAEDFKKYSKIKSNVVIESFDSYDSYYYALAYAISSGNAPDIFVLNNNERNPIFENQTMWIAPDIVNPNNFRKDYKPYISEQIITKTDNWTEFLLWMPVWYETLWIFYNRRFVKASDLENISSLRSTVWNLKEKNPDVIPIAMWNWTTVDDSEDIATNFIMMESGDKSIEWLTRKAIQWWIWNYISFWDEEGDNWYNSRFKEMTLANQTAIDLFSKWETFMVAWYPRLIKKINDKWFSSSFLLAAPFPTDSKTEAALINYNYFVINKDTKKLDLANTFVSYLSTERWIKLFLETYPYYLPAHSSFEQITDSQMIHKNYKIAISDFYNESYSYSSFNKWIKNYYDLKIKTLLDEPEYSIDYFSRLQRSVNCKSLKAVELDDISKNCD